MLAKNNLRRIHYFVLVALLLLPIATLSPTNNTAHAATTTTKYLNGKIVFVSQRDGNREIYTVNPDGTNQTRLTNNPATDSGAAWSPDGNKIVFQTNRDGNNEIYTMNADGSNQTNLSNNPASDFIGRGWSPDGTKMAFTSARDGNNEIYTMNADGSNQTNLSNDADHDAELDWSPDGTKVTFISYPGGDQEIYIVDSNGSNLMRITNSPGEDNWPTWSPDGTRIAFTSDRDSGVGPYNEDTYIMNPDGTNVVRVANTVAEEEIPFYSPNGTQLLTTTWPDEDYASHDLQTIHINGTNQTQITTGGSDEAFGSAPWLGLPYTQTVNDDGSITSVIAAGDDYSSTDYTVVSGETLILDGTLCDVTVESGGTLQGTGSIAPNCTLTVEPGGVVAPGHSPGCLASGNVIFSGTYQAEIAGTTPCTGYDQLQVTGTVDLSGSTLTTSLLNGFVPTTDNSFTIIQNDAADSVTGTFTGLPEGATVTIGSSVFKISYTGGDGNDVTLTAQAIPGVPETGVETINSNLPHVVLILTMAAGALIVVSKKTKATEQKLWNYLSKINSKA